MQLLVEIVNVKLNDLLQRIKQLDSESLIKLLRQMEAELISIGDSDQPENEKKAVIQAYEEAISLILKDLRSVSS